MKTHAKLLAPLSILIVAGCTVPNERADLETRTSTRLEAMLVSDKDTVASVPKTAALLPANAEHYAGVVEKADATIHSREIRLEGSVPGQPVNHIEIRTLAGDAANPLVSSLKPSDAGIHSELVSRFPRVAMKVAEARRNAHGPLGLAFGAPSSRVRCVYAWQFVDDLPVTDDGQATHALFHSQRSVSASVRISVCRAGTTADELAAYVEQLKIDAAPSTQPASLEATLVPPVAGAAVVHPRKIRTASHRRPRRSARVYTAKAAEPAANSADDAGDQASGVDRGPAPSRRAGGVPVPADPGQTRGSSTPVFAASGQPTTLDQSLPSQAYLGPSSVKNAQPRNVGPDVTGSTFSGSQAQ